MSDWTEVTGRHNSKKVSVKKLAQLIIGGDELGFDKQENGEEFSFSFSSTGGVAAKLLDQIIKEFKKLDKNALISMEAQIGFYG